MISDIARLSTTSLLAACMALLPLAGFAADPAPAQASIS
mgnify:CR=1 FL=1